MRGSPFTLIAVGVGAALTPAVLDIDVTGDATGQTVLDLLAPMGTLIGLAFALTAFGLLLVFFTDSGM
jgi:hypothetical protein